MTETNTRIGKNKIFTTILGIISIIIIITILSVTVINNNSLQSIDNSTSLSVEPKLSEYELKCRQPLNMSNFKNHQNADISDDIKRYILEFPCKIERIACKSYIARTVAICKTFSDCNSMRINWFRDNCRGIYSQSLDFIKSCLNGNAKCVIRWVRTTYLTATRQI